MTDLPTIAITGANGFIGSHLVSMFRDAGFSVVALSHEALTQPKDGVTRRRFHLDPKMDLPDLSGCGVLIHCAYVKHLPGQAAEMLNVQGTQRLLAAARQAGVKQFIFFSSLSAHTAAVSSYGRTKFTIENLLDPAHDLILRPGLVLGNGGLFGNMLRTIQNSRLVPLVDNGRQELQTIDIEDLSLCVRAAVEHGITGKYTLIADERATLRGLVESIRARSERKPLLVPVPYWVVSAGLSVIEALRIPLAVRRENLLGLRQNIMWEGGAALRIFGVQPRSYHESIERLSRS